MNTVRRVECTKAVEIIAKALWKSHEQTGDSAVNKSTPEQRGIAVTGLCELRVNFCQMPGMP
jgi:hypothetical protein